MTFRQTGLDILIRARDISTRVLERFRKQLKDTDEDAEKTADGGLRKLTRQATAAVTAFFGFRQIGRVLTDVFRTGDRFEGLALQLEGVMGSLEGGEQAVEWIREFTRNTPLQLEQVTEAFVTLKNFGLDPQAGTLQAIVDQNELLGGGYERLIGIVRAYGQANAKQKLQGEEILQLIERGVPVWQLLADATGRTTAELNEMSSNGELTTDVIQQLIEAMGRNATGAAERNMSRLSGVISNLRDTWTGFLNQVATSGALDVLRDQLQRLQGFLNRIAQDGTLERWALNASRAIEQLITTTVAIGRGLFAVLPAIKAFGAAWVAIKIGSIVANLGRMATVLGTKIPAGARAAALSLNGLKLASLAGAAINLGVQVGRLVASFLQLRDANEALKRSQTGLAEGQAEAADLLALYSEQTGKTAESLDQLIALQEAGEVAFDRSNNQFIVGREAVAAYREELLGTADATERTADITRTAFSGAVDTVITQFDALIAKGKSSREALESVFGNYDITATQDVAVIVAALIELENQSKVTGEQIETAIGGALSNLSAAELRVFTTNVRLAFEQGRIDAQAFAGTIDGAVSSALRQLGVDIELAETGISEAGRAGIDNFRLVASEIEASGDSAEVASRKILAAFLGALERIQTEAGRDELLASLREQVDAGTISWQEYEQAVAAANERLREQSGEQEQLSGSIDATTDAVRRLKQEQQQTTEVVTEAGVSGGAAYEIMTKAIAAFTAQVEELGPKAREMWESLVTGQPQATEGLGELEQALADTYTELTRLERSGLRVFDATGLRGEIIEMAKAAQLVEREFIQQQIALRDLQQGYEDGTI
ncbi:MAG: tape measure protein, partial [Pseudomonadota bacterium]